LCISISIDTVSLFLFLQLGLLFLVLLGLLGRGRVPALEHGDEWLDGVVLPEEGYLVAMLVQEVGTDGEDLVVGVVGTEHNQLLPVRLSSSELQRGSVLLELDVLLSQRTH